MRNLSDIINDTKDNKKPDYEELRYSVLALASLLNLERMDLNSIDKDTSELILNLKKTYSFQRYHQALNTDPKEWLGWNDDPENAEYQAYREIGNRILNKISKKFGQNEEK